ncbi:MAG: hypothetical protein SVK08_12755 [Halobacteriota archaeon]|nr:hypothetical protein [Halobacteriota archaeon]
MTKEQLIKEFEKVAAEFQIETGFRVDRVDFSYLENINNVTGVRNSQLLETKVEVK